jgi:hypothetical protein
MKSKILRCITAMTLSTVLAISVRSSAQEQQQDDHGYGHEPKLIEFDAPRAAKVSSTVCAPFCGTYALDITLEGTTAGAYVDEEGVYHGFVRSSLGEITSFDPTGSVFTFVCEETCLNLEGTITGYYSDASGVIHGFVGEPGGDITTLDAPGASGFTGGASINPEGTITGYFLDSSSVAHGFVRTRGGDFKTFDVPADTGAVQTAAFSINLLGAVTGEL